MDEPITVGREVGVDLVNQYVIKKFNNAEILFRPCTRLMRRIYALSKPSRQRKATRGRSDKKY
jgi:hypothetical protein